MFSNWKVIKESVHKFEGGNQRLCSQIWMSKRVFTNLKVIKASVHKFDHITSSRLGISSLREYKLTEIKIFE